MLLASYNSIHYTQAFNVFWKFRSDSSECYMEDELIHLVLEHPTHCYQGINNSSSPMTTKDCVRNIKCNKKNGEKIDFDTVPMCKTDNEMICCLNSYQCESDTKGIETTNYQSECQYLRNSRTKSNGIHKQAGQCVFPFTYHGMSYYKCTVFTDSNCFRWCATLVDSNNVYIKKSGLWGYCDNTCPVNYEEKCHNETRIPMFKKEFDADSKNVQIKTKTCGTQNTTTLIKSKDGGPREDFTLFNPGNCSFPFKYRGVWYSTCITKDDPLCRYWCSVRNDHGYHRKLGSKWAYCNKDCPLPKDKHEDICPGKTQGRGKGGLNKHFFEDEFATYVYLENEDPNFIFDYDAYGSKEED